MSRSSITDRPDASSAAARAGFEQPPARQRRHTPTDDRACGPALPLLPDNRDSGLVRTAYAAGGWPVDVPLRARDRAAGGAQFEAGR
jgi:hypothetical protein